MASTLTAARPGTAGRKAVRPLAHRTFQMIHLVVGLTFGSLLVVQGLSGSVLVWRPELDRLLFPSLTHTPASHAQAAPWDRMHPGLDFGLAAVRNAAPDGVVRTLRLPVAPDGTDEWMVQLPAAPGKSVQGKRLTIYTAPDTGRLLGIRGQRVDALSWLIELHHNLLTGSAGRVIQGYLAIVTIVLTLSGLWLWWPASWTLSRFRPRAAAKPLHYAVGFWVMGPLLVIAITATYLVWRQPMQRVFGVPDGRGAGDSQTRKQNSSRRQEKHPPARGEVLPEAVDLSSLDAVLRAAHQAEPDARLTVIRLPEDGHGSYSVSFESATENYRAAPNSVLVRIGEDGNAQAVRTSLWRDLPAKQRFLEWLPRIHQGEFGSGDFGGTLVRLIWSITGMCPAMLFIIGFLMWRRRLPLRER